MKVKPLNNNILIKLKDEPETKSGIILVGKESGETNVAEIVEIADSSDQELGVLLKGDQILVQAKTGVRLDIDDEEYWIIQQKDVLGIVK